VLEERPGFIVFRASGADAAHVFQHEPGGHRWQRVPPNEKRGRVHTSTVTVAVLQEPHASALVIPPTELEWRTSRGSGPGGQHRNKTESAVVLTHLPSGLTVRCESERSQHRNRDTALRVLRARLLQARQEGSARAANAERRSQMGSGQRGDKVRTIRCQDGLVTDHRLGRKLTLDAYLRGEWAALIGA
jgi:peptide chain release factor 1